MFEQFLQLMQEQNDLLRALLERDPAMAGETWLEPEEAAAHIHVTYDTILAYRRQGIIPGVQPGGHKVLFRKSALDEYLVNLEKEQSAGKKEPANKEYGKLRPIVCK